MYPAEKSFGDSGRKSGALENALNVAAVEPGSGNELVDRTDLSRDEELIPLATVNDSAHNRGKWQLLVIFWVG